MDRPKEPDAGPHVRFCERRGGAIHRAYSTVAEQRKVCPAWALDWRWKSFTGRVGSNREPEATACRVARRETRCLAPRGRVGKKSEANRSTERK